MELPEAALKPRRGKLDTVYVLPRHRLAICLVNKVASQSIQTAALESMGMTWDVRGANRETDFWLDPSDPAIEGLGFPVVALIREPIDRFLSAYLWRCRVGFQTSWAGTRTLDECLNSCRTMFRRRDPLRPYDVHFTRQSPRVRPAQMIGRFDRIAEWWARVQAMSALPLPDLPMCNAAPDGKPVLSKGQISALHALYRPDFKLYERTQGELGCPSR